MIAEGNETPGGESGGAPEGRGRRSEGDLLAERRARRAAESGEHALTLRAEAAEATVRTLETHVASLQQRVREAEEERRRTSEPADVEPTSRAGGWRSQEPATEGLLERELQRASQREYAEQRLRLEAEDRCVEAERDGRAEIDLLSRRLSASERDARTLTARLEILQRELAEAEQAAAAELADLRSVAVLSAERALQTRLSELERRAVEINRGLDAERNARVRAEQLLERMRSGQRSAIGLVVELGGVVARLKEGASSAPPAPRAPIDEAPLARGGQAIPAVSSSGEGPSGEMAAALAAAVERLRARVEEHPEHSHVPPVERPTHKHSMSLITRWRLALRARREARK